MKIMDMFDEMMFECKREAEEANKKAKEKMEEKKVYNRGTVVAAMAKKGFGSWDMDRVLEKVKNPEQAEAAVGLIEAGYDSWDTCRVLEHM